LLAAQQIDTRYLPGESGYIVLAHFAGIASLVDAQVAASHGPIDLRPLRSVIRKEVTVVQRLVLGLVLHVLAAGHARQS
jgi:hypothetical protein